MAHVISAVEGEVVNMVEIKTALLSVSDKTGLVELAQFLSERGVRLLSTGGTAGKMREAGLTVTDVSEYTQFPECLDGRVKTLHPLVHGGLLGVRGNAEHERQMAENGIQKIDLVVLNLYAFEHTVQSGNSFGTCVENIDIGGPSMLRSSAKNHAYVAIATAPSQYAELMAEMSANNGCTSLDLRRRLAARAFATSAAYDSAIAGYFASQVPSPAPAVARCYAPPTPLKYGCNPQQKPAGISPPLGGELPFSVLNGSPGYINLLDALNAWQLVSELKEALGLPAATSFKHVSPAGAAVAVPLTEEEREAYEVGGVELTPLALAYIKARNADPMSSFGDFVAVSDEVDVATAEVLRREVSDGIIAPGYSPEALAILSNKKGGKFVVLQATAGYTPPPMEYREVYGAALSQRRNDARITPASLTDVRAGASPLPEEAVRDLVVASVTLKYTQSNSVGYAKNGMMIGVGAGQQSRVDCVKLAGRKVAVWWLRQHPKVKALAFREGTKRQERVNARVRYIEGDMTDSERVDWEAKLDTVPEPLTEEDKASFLASLDGVSLSSDAFFPFRDSIDHASRLGVKYVAEPGGSVQDEDVFAAANSYGMSVAITGPEARLFHH